MTESSKRFVQEELPRGDNARKRTRTEEKAILQPSPHNSSRIYGEPHTSVLNTPHHISSIYWVSEWSKREAFREIFSNMTDQAHQVAREFFHDAKIEILEEVCRFVIYVGLFALAELRWCVEECDYVDQYGEEGVYKFRATFNKVKKRTLVVEFINYSSSLPWDAFRVGASTKKNSKCVIGKHGEGLSAACVALLKINCNVSAACTSSKYTAQAAHLGKDVYFQLDHLKKHSPGSVVTFRLVFDPATYETVNVQDLLNEIRLPSAAAKIITTRGELLTDPVHKGKYFNRGIFVEHCPQSLFGYNFYDPDKNLLAGRDRNRSARNIGKECWAILSEAIVQDQDVRERVLQVYMYHGDGAPGAGGIPFQYYEDIREGKYISESALEALRELAEQQKGGDKRAIFCASSSLLLNLISELKGLRIIYSHKLLHNHASVLETFNAALTAEATPFPPDSRIRALQDRLLPLLGTATLLRSPLEVPTVGFWRVDDAVYVTGSEKLTAGTYLSPSQECSIHSSLQSCSVPLIDTITLVRLLRGESGAEEAPTVHSEDAAGNEAQDDQDKEEVPAPASQPESGESSANTSMDVIEVSDDDIAEDGVDEDGGAAAVDGDGVDGGNDVDDGSSVASFLSFEADAPDRDREADHAAPAALPGGAAAAARQAMDDAPRDVEAHATACAAAPQSRKTTAAIHQQESQSSVAAVAAVCDGAQSLTLADDAALPPVLAVPAVPAAPGAPEAAAPMAAAPTEAAAPATAAPTEAAVPATAAPVARTAPEPPASLSLRTRAGEEVQVALRGRHAATGILLYSNDDDRGEKHGQMVLDAFIRNPRARESLLAVASIVNIVVFSVVDFNPAAGDSIAPVQRADGDCVCINLLNQDVAFTAASLRVHLRE